MEKFSFYIFGQAAFTVRDDFEVEASSIEEAREIFKKALAENSEYDYFIERGETFEESYDGVLHIEDELGVPINSQPAE